MKKKSTGARDLPFTARAMLDTLRGYRNVDWGSTDPAQVKRQDAFLREWAEIHRDAQVPLPDFLLAVLQGPDRRRARG